MASRLIVGLGNPGQNYAETRHNAGFLLVDRLVDRLGAQARAGGHGYMLWMAQTDRLDIALVKPLTYMNLSGLAVAEFLRRHPLTLDEVLVVYDDVALPLGAIRIRPAGSAGGQKGMRHIIETLETDQLARLRIGVDAPFRAGEPLADFVLSDFREEELPDLRDALARAEEAAIAWLHEDIAQVMARFNVNQKSESSTLPSQAET